MGKVDEVKILPAEEFDAEYLRLIGLDIADAQKHLDELPESERRGLSSDTLRHFHCGYLRDWILTKCRAELACGLYVNAETGEQKHLPPASERIIIPTSSMNHFNAVATPRARRSMDKRFVKQHAGTMELFCDPAALNADTIVVVEGEVDAMSIWQATRGEVAVVAILGCANQQKTLSARLSEFNDKRFIILLDADEAGKKNAKALRDKLFQERYPAVVRFLYDYLPINFKRDPHSVKVDANEILIQHGEETLQSLMKRILESAESELDFAVEQIQQAKIFSGTETANPSLIVPNTEKLALPSTVYQSSDSRDFDIWRAGQALRIIPVAALTYDEWRNVGMALKNNGNSCEDWEQWSRNDKRFKVGECDRLWLNFNRSGFTIATIIEIAKRYGYDAKAIQHHWYDLHPDLKPSAQKNIAADTQRDDDREFNNLIAKWQENNQNIPIDDKIIASLKDACNFINSLSVETFSADLAFDISVRRKVALCKFYIPQLARKFFGILKDAQRKAATEIRKLKAQKPPALIPDDLNELFRLKPSEFGNAVDEFVTQIKRDQKAFRKDFQAQQEKREFEAKRQALLDSQLSTQKQIPDCPVDLFLPDSVYFDKHGVGTQSFNKRGELIANPAALTPIIPTKILREPSKHITQYEIAIKARGIWRSVVVDGDELADARKILRLATYGAIIEHAAELTHFFAKILAANEEQLTEIKCFQQTGWKDRAFTDFAYPTGGDNYLVRRAGFNYEVDCESFGDPDIWKKTFLDACQDGGAIARVFIGTALAAPLVQPLNIPNMQTHLVGEPNSGKSALEKLAASVFGNPRKLIRTFGATLKNRQAAAAAFNDMPTFLDELGTVTGGKKGENSLAQMVYEFFEGKANQANKRDGTARETFEFSGTRISSAEHPMLKSHDAQGAYKRLLQINCNKRLLDKDLAFNLHFVTKNNYGHFGRPWIKFIAEHSRQIEEKYFEFERLYNKLPIKRDIEETLFRTVVVSALTFQFFLICLGEKKEFDNIQFCEDIKAIILTLPTLSDIDEATRALKSLQSFVAGHDRFFTHETERSDYNNEFVQSAFECYGKKFKNGEIAFLPTALQKILENELGFSSMDAIVKKWSARGLLRCTSGDNLRFSTRINGQKVKTYRFKADTFFNSDAEHNADMNEATVGD